MRVRGRHLVCGIMAARCCRANHRLRATDGWHSNISHFDFVVRSSIYRLRARYE
jgi:hypothetical protein